MIRASAAGVPIDYLHGGLAIVLVHDPDIRPALVDGDFSRTALQVNTGEPTADAGLLQQVEPVLPDQQIRGTRQSNHESPHGKKP